MRRDLLPRLPSSEAAFLASILDTAQRGNRAELLYPLMSENLQDESEVRLTIINKRSAH